MQQDYVNTSERDDDVYNVPNAQAPSVYDSPASVAHAQSSLRRVPSERDSNSSNGSKTSQPNSNADSGLGSIDNLERHARDTRTSDVYHTPPPAKPSPAARQPQNIQLLNAVPPPAQLHSRTAVPSPKSANRSPKSANRSPKSANRSPYVNLNESEYDFPPPSKHHVLAPKVNDSAMLDRLPPPHHTAPTDPAVHHYINANAPGVSMAAQMKTCVKASAEGATGPPQAYLPMNRKDKPGSYLPMNKPGVGGDSYTPMSPGSSDSYTPMSPGSDSYTPMTGTQMPRHLQGESRTSEDYTSYDPRASTDSTYQVLPPGVHPINTDYDNRIDEYRESMAARQSTAERDSIYTAYPSNRPVEPSPSLSDRRLDAIVPCSPHRSSPSVRRAREVPLNPVSTRESDGDIYDVAPTNIPVAMRGWCP